jgi:hypothetical protein
MTSTVNQPSRIAASRVARCSGLVISSVAQRQARHIVRQIDQTRANALRLEKVAHVGERGVAEAKAASLLFSEALPLLDRLSARLRRWERV